MPIYINHAGQPFNTDQEQLTELLDEARAHWNHYSQQMADNLVPRYLLKLNKDIKNVIIVDTSQSRLLLYKNENGVPSLLYDFYASIGKNGVGKLTEGDKKTPIGVYFISRFLAPDNLPDYYGDGAFPLNYPNSWDKFRGRGGSGIWLHGNPLGTFSRPPLDSDGCVTVSNDDLEKLKPYIAVDQKTPVIITNKIEWVSVKDIQRRKNDFLARLMQWKKDWESMNRTKFLSHYSREFDAEGKDYNQWVRKVSYSMDKTPVNIAINDISIFQGYHYYL